MRGESLKGHLDLLVLAVLAERPLHGYAVIEQLRERSGQAFDLPEGTVYPVLHRLERAGQLASAWAMDSGRRRRIYRLTSTGWQTLQAEQHAWTEFATAVSRVLGGPAWSTP